MLPIPKRTFQYAPIIEKIFFTHYQPGMIEFTFQRVEIETVAQQFGIRLPKNLGDVIYSFRFRAQLPQTIIDTAPDGFEWIIRLAGGGIYQFALVREARFIPNPMLNQTKILDATPGIVQRYSLDDEQALLAKIRYNRLLDIFTGLTCYSLQNHLRTSIPGMGQVETDELYVGVDSFGSHYILPVQSKGGTDKIGIGQIEQDFAVCGRKFPSLIGRPIAAQFIDSITIAMFEFIQTVEGIRIAQERHYRLSTLTEFFDQDLEIYRRLSTGHTP